MSGSVVSLQPGEQVPPLLTHVSLRMQPPRGARGARGLRDLGTYGHGGELGGVVVDVGHRDDGRGRVGEAVGGAAFRVRGLDY